MSAKRKQSEISSRMAYNRGNQRESAADTLSQHLWKNGIKSCQIVKAEHGRVALHTDSQVDWLLSRQELRGLGWEADRV